MSAFKPKTKKGLLYKWRRDAKALHNKADKTWRLLGNGRLDQVDAIIYSVYEAHAQAHTLNQCVAELCAVIEMEEKT